MSQDGGDFIKRTEIERIIVPFVAIITVDKDADGDYVVKMEVNVGFKVLAIKQPLNGPNGPKV